LGKFIDLTGQRFGRLVALKRVEDDKHKHAQWLCKCDCGNEKIIIGNHFKTGNTKSCGCLRNETKKGKRIIIQVGQRFGKLVTVKRVEKPEHLKTKREYWLCKCDCGNEKIINSSSLKDGMTKSCGCLRNENVSKKAKTLYGTASFNQLYGSYKRNAKARNYLFELTKEYVKKITKQNCFYCGAEPNQTIKNKFDNGDYIYNGIDRIDSLKGYTVDNVVPCCGRCNEAKMSESQQDFLSWVERVYNHSVKGKE